MAEVKAMQVQSGARFRVNDAQVVHEVFDGEVLVINLDSGTYYSLLGVGASLWQWLLQGATVQAMTQVLAERHLDDAAVIQAAVAEFVDKLAEQKLIVPADASNGAAFTPPGSPAAKTRFARPVIEIFTDMQDLLLLDPIHEVSESGWPVIKPPAAKQAES
jgi:coenzyme PQQ synthesis protein D (PqqD)